MDNLRWLLLLIGMALFGGIYYWEMSRRKGRRDPTQMPLEPMDDDLLQDLEIERDTLDEGEMRAALGGLDIKGERLGGANANVIGSDDLDRLAPKRVESSDDLKQTVEATKRAPREGGEEVVIALNLLSAEGEAFSGANLRKAFDEVDMLFGEMRIFHHYGVDRERSDYPVFSLANILEPGVFDPATMDEMVSPGVCLFLRLPGPVDGLVAFELMLNTAQRLAESLEGRLCDETRSALSRQTIARTRERIAEFERRRRHG